jgi:hypothetical protein
MHERSKRTRILRLIITMIAAALAVAGLSIGSAWANPEPSPPAEAPPPAEDAPAQPTPDAEAPSAPAPAPAGEPFIPPEAQVETPAAPTGQPTDAVPPAAPGSPSSSGSDASPTTSRRSSPSGTERAVGTGVALAGVGAAAAGGLLGRRRDETPDGYTRRMAGTTIWTAGGVAVLIAKGLTLGSGVGAGACLVIAGAIWLWGAPGRTRSEPAPPGPPVALEQHFDAARDHNLDLNRVGARTQSQTTSNPVDDP